MSRKNFTDVLNDFEIVLTINFMVLGLSLAICAAWMFSYGIRIYWRLRVLYRDSDKKSIRDSAVKRVNIALFAISVCFAFRIASLCILIYDILTNSETANKFSDFGWFLFTNWIPSIVPVLCV